jgi:hypothetical protein
MIELVELLTAEIKSTQTINKLLLEELNRIGGEYKLNQELTTQEKPNTQNKIYPLNGNVTVGRNSENPKKHKGKQQGVQITKSKQRVNNIANLTYNHPRNTKSDQYQR